MPANAAGAPLPSGTLLSRYKVLRLLGAGGMGEVYEATDQQLGRRVALKILPAGRASDAVRVERFLREAQTASSLNHPAIVSVFDAGSADGIEYLAMELIDGQTLGEWARSTRDTAKRVEVLAQIADGLARAHAAGIVHRDLKPENIMVARGGYPKIVDFGIAKLTERTPGPILTDSDTPPAALLGTAAYMAPEQVEARPVDHRADVFAFGCVMHAVFGGRSPFARTTTIDTMHAILHDDAPPLPNAPPSLQRVARRCLSRDAEERYQSMRDVALDLREAAREPAIAPARRWPLVVGFALVLTAITTSILLMRRAPVVPQPAAAILRLTNSGAVMSSAISPDGNYLVYAAEEGDRMSIAVKQIASGRTVVVVPPAPVWYLDLRVTPDGNYIVYETAPRANPNVVQLERVPMLGGEPRKIADDVEPGCALTPDGKQVAFRRFSAVDRENVVFIADIEGGNERAILRRHAPDFIGSFAFTPDGKHLTFTGLRPSAKELIRVALYDLDLASGRVEAIDTPAWPGIGTIAWLPDASGMLVAAAGPQQPPQIWFLPRDASKARKITNDLAAYNSLTVTADAKAIVANRMEISANLAVVRFGQPDKADSLTAGVGNDYGRGGAAWLSPNEVIYTSLSAGQQSLDVKNVTTGETRHLTHNCCWWDPLVSPDGKHIAALSSTGNQSELFIMDRDGSNARQLTHAGGVISPAWYPDSRTLAYVTNASVQVAWRQSIDETTAHRLTNTPVNSIRISPDGKSMLCRYRSAEPGRPLWRTAVVPLGGGPLRFFDEIPRSYAPRDFEWLADGSGFVFIDAENSVANLWLQPLDGSPARPMTRLDTRRVWAYNLSPDGGSAVVSTGDALNDAVLIRDFR